MTLNHYIEI